MACTHGNALLFVGDCPCDVSCFCRRHGVCRDVVAEQAQADIEVRRRTTDKMPPLSKSALKIEIDLDNPQAVAEFLEAVALSIRLRRRVVLTVD
jgi:hypothetical protein